MLFSRNWLTQYVELPDDPHLVAERLTFAGFAVEGIEDRGTDVLFDVEVTTNRPDCMNHLGLARELAVLFDRPLKRPASQAPPSQENAAGAARLEIEDHQGCPRYAARVLRGVKVGPSPAWLADRLQAIGVRSINNVVDVTNFVLWETGQPLHAFDLHKLAQSTIVVRRARAGERLVTLDGVDRALDPEILVIADAERPVGLGGVMGGLDSEVTEATVDVLLESAHFDRRRVRLTCRKLGLHTDASHRFERGADPVVCADAATRAAALIAEVAGGVVLEGVLDVRDEKAVWTRQGTLDLAKLNAFAGATVEAADAERWLTGLGFGLTKTGEGIWRVTVPSWRYYDFEPRPEPPHEAYPADLYEEVLRIFGLNNIPSGLPAIGGSDGPQTPRQLLRARLRRLLAASGYAEGIHFAFLDPRLDAAFPSLRPGAAAIRLANPLSEQYSVLRRSVGANLVEAARFNQRRGASSVRLFEVANVFFASSTGGALPDQPEHAGLVCGGTVGDPWQRAVELDLLDLKGAVDEIAAHFGVRLDARPAQLPGLVPGMTAELLHGGSVVGFFGQVDGDDPYPLFVAELATSALEEGAISLKVEAPSRLPGIAADLTLTHAVTTPWAEIDRAIAELAPPDLVSWSHKDRYRGPGVAEGTVNTTIAFVYNAGDRSLTQDEVNARQLPLGEELARRFGWRG